MWSLCLCSKIFIYKMIWYNIKSNWGFETWRRFIVDHLARLPRARPLHCTPLRLTPAISPSWETRTHNFLVWGLRSRYPWIKRTQHVKLDVLSALLLNGHGHAGTVTCLCFHLALWFAFHPPFSSTQFTTFDIFQVSLTSLSFNFSLPCCTRCLVSLGPRLKTRLKFEPFAVRMW